MHIATEVFKLLKNLNPSFMNEMFNVKDTRTISETQILYFNNNLIRLDMARIPWKLLPNDNKICTVIIMFKKSIRQMGTAKVPMPTRVIIET